MSRRRNRRLHSASLTQPSFDPLRVTDSASESNRAKAESRIKVERVETASTEFPVYRLPFTGFCFSSKLLLAQHLSCSKLIPRACAASLVLAEGEKVCAGISLRGRLPCPNASSSSTTSIRTLLPFVRKPSACLTQSRRTGFAYKFSTSFKIVERAWKLISTCCCHSEFIGKSHQDRLVRTQ